MVNKFSLAGNTFTPEIHLKSLNLLMVFVYHLLKTKKYFKNLMKQELQNIFTKMNLMKLVFNMAWLLEILKI